LRRVSIAILAVAVCLASSWAAASAERRNKSAGPSKSQVVQRLSLRLEKSALFVLEPPQCRRLERKTLFRCQWQAQGHPPAEVPFDCDGTAKLNTRKGRWRIEGCERRLVTLTDAGPLPLFGYHDLWRSRGDLQLAARGGAQVVRQALEWDNVEPSRGEYVWYWYDQLYYRMIASGVRPIWYLATPPCWAQRQTQDGGNCSAPGTPAPAYHADLAKLAGEAAKRYPLSAGIQVWNEPNYIPYWGSEPDPRAYGDMALRVADAVHSTGTDIPVISAGLAPMWADSENGMAADSFLREAYETGGPQQTDAIGVHPYAFGNFTQDYLSEVRAALYRHVAVMNEFGEADKPIWVTEIGISNYIDARGFTVEEQAVALTAMHELFLRIPSVDAVVIHRLQDDPWAADAREPGYGVVDADGNPKPAFCALAAVRGASC
jgi:hypothetical protein